MASEITVLNNKDASSVQQRLGLLESRATGAYQMAHSQRVQWTLRLEYGYALTYTGIGFVGSARYALSYVGLCTAT